MKKAIITLLAAVIAAGTAVSVSAWTENEDYVNLGKYSATANYPGSTTAWPEVTSGQLLTGDIITSVGMDATIATSLFDGDATTSCQMNGGWVGILLDEAYTLTEVRYIPHPDEAAGPSGWFSLQGSNDGVHWGTIIAMRQDATGTDYHIFSPQTIEDERYTAAGYKARTDESIHWLDNYGSYKMYRICSNHIGDVEFYGNPAPATDISTDELYSARTVASSNYYPFIVHVRSTAEVKNAVDGSLVGTIIGGGGIWNKAMYEKAFDNNNKTHFDPSIEGPECWVGMMFDEPHAITEVRLLPKRGTQEDMRDGRFQGSLDGVNWVNLAVTTEADVATSKQEWIIKEITDTKGYTYFRYVSVADKQSTLSEMLLFGAPAEAAEPFTVDPLIATQHTYSGNLYYAENKNTVVAGEISGTPICGDKYFGWRDNGTGLEQAFDGDDSKVFYPVPRLVGPNYWLGLRADAPTIVGKVRYNVSTTVRPTVGYDIYFQGSLDGHSWVDLACFGPDDTQDADGYYTEIVTDTTAYEYFRLYHPSGVDCSELKIYAAETTAPETAAPETTAPETTAPETTAPETTAPAETSAPTGDDEPTAPQTFDFGVVAAVTAIVSAAGYALTKKRK